MWPFKKKTKVVTLEGDAATNFMKSLAQSRMAQECPPELTNSGLCVCMDCPKRGSCWSEKWNHNVMQCSWFNRACSYKAQLLGRLSGYEKFIVDPYFAEKYGKVFMAGITHTTCGDCTKEKCNAKEKDANDDGNSCGDESRWAKEVPQ